MRNALPLCRLDRYRPPSPVRAVMLVTKMVDATAQLATGQCVLIVGVVRYRRREVLKQRSKSDGRAETNILVGRILIRNVGRRWHDVGDGNAGSLMVATRSVEKMQSPKWRRKSAGTVGRWGRRDRGPP